MNLLNPFLYLPSLSALSLSIIKIHIFFANSRDITNMNKIDRTTCRYSRDRCKRVSSWYNPVWIGSTGSHCRVLDVVYRYSRVRLTEIEAVNVRMVTHRKVFSHRILLVAYYVIQDKNRIWARLVRWTTSLLLENEKYTISSIDVNKFSRYQCFGCCDFE